MKLIVLADIHGNESLISQIAGPLKEADLVLLAGDITNFGGREDVLKIIQVLNRYNSQILAVHGNCDLPAVEEVLELMKINLDSRCKTINHINFIGIGGSLPCPGTTPNEIGESVFKDILESFSATGDADVPVVLVTHQPPYGTAIDAVSGSDRHTGSRSIRRFIEKYQPILTVSGHIHEGRGVDKLNNTVLVNPGPFRNGFYATIEIEGRSVKPELHSIT